MEELSAHKAEIEKVKAEAAETARAAAAKKAAEAPAADTAVKAEEPGAEAMEVQPHENGAAADAMDVDGTATGGEGNNSSDPAVKNEEGGKPDDQVGSTNDENTDPASNTNAAAEPEMIKAEQPPQAPAVDAEMADTTPDANAAEGADTVQAEQAGTGREPEGGEAGTAADADADAPIIVTEDEIKQAWMQVREELYQRTKEELAKRKQFEDQIKRPYFHVKALDALQLNNWNSYLTFIEQHGDEAAIITLYERCLVACASYPGGFVTPSDMSS
jgi:pre-mRNA-processing factor 39